MTASLHACVYIIYVPSIRGGQKNMSNPLELEL